MKETVTLNSEEQRRLLILNQLERGSISLEQAADLIGVSRRQVHRLRSAYRDQGAAALVHGNRGRSPVHALDPALRHQLLTLAQTTYADCNHQHLSELLLERESIQVSRSSLRRILLQAGISSPRTRRPPKHRSRRDRSPQEGMLLQLDSSRHDWLLGRGPFLTLVGAIDDATNIVPSALFRESEDAHGYFLLMQQIVRDYGCPLAVYRDRHGIFERSPSEPETLAEQLRGTREPTQFGRLLAELTIRSIAARSPQAKGRIERLWGTLQDRLVVELRLAGATTLADANEVLGSYLPRFNQRFALQAAEPERAYRALQPHCEAERLFCFKYLRTVASDNTVRLGEHRLQLLPGQRRVSWAKCEVEVHERLDGSLAVYSQAECIATKAAPEETPLLRARQGKRAGSQADRRALAPDGEAGSPRRVQDEAESGGGRRAEVSGPPKAPKERGQEGGSHRRSPPADHPWKRRFKPPREEVAMLGNISEERREEK
jgi:transposase